MHDESRDAGRAPGAAADALGRVVGLLVFLAGIVLLVVVFVWAYQLFDRVDEYIDSAAPAQVAQNPNQDGNVAPPPAPAPPSRTLAQVAAIIGLKLLAVFALGYCASLVAGRGAGLVAAHRTAGGAPSG